MNSEVIIKAENLSKKYNLQHLQKDEYGNETSELWALKNVSFEIKKGESIGIIGSNGSGKSTLLKILAGVTQPTSGRVEINGRIASILDIGAGFHPDLSGRENVFLNGQILGFSNKDILKKFDEINEFSGIEKFIDEPVKNYSNGMYLRLAFSILVHLDFDVYLFDEVMTVGDDDFRKKAIEKFTSMKDKTILLAYHGLIPWLFFNRKLRLEKGIMTYSDVENSLNGKWNNTVIESQPLVSFEFNDRIINIKIETCIDEHNLVIQFESDCDDNNSGLILMLYNNEGLQICNHRIHQFSKVKCKKNVWFPLKQIKGGRYFIRLVFVDLNTRHLIYDSGNLITFETNGYISENSANIWSDSICLLNFKEVDV